MSEQDIMRQLTLAFIETMPVNLVLTPHTYVKTDAGGTVATPGSPKGVQRLRFVELDTRPNDPVRTQDGIERRADFILLGSWDADIAVNDTLTYDGDDFTVIEMYYDNGWETRAKVARHGG